MAKADNTYRVEITRTIVETWVVHAPTTHEASMVLGARLIPGDDPGFVPAPDSTREISRKVGRPVKVSE